MVREKGKANASTKRSVSGRAAVASEAALTNESSDVENNVETGGSAETAVTEQTMITVVVEEENGEEEHDGAEEENDGEEEHDGAEEENDGPEAEIEEELAMEEDEGYKENEVVGGGDETCSADNKEEDAIDNDEGNNQETAIEEEDGKQNVDDNQETAIEQEGGKQNVDEQVGGAVGLDKGNQEDGMGKNEDETNANEKKKEKVEGSLKQKTKRWRKRNNRKRKANGTPLEKDENKQVMKKVASNGKVSKDLGKLDSKVVEQSSKKVASGDKSRMAPKDMDFEGKDKPEPSSKKSSPKKKANGMGMIFMCNSETKKDCYRYKVLGLPANKKEIVEKIYKGTRLFLYDVDLKLMYGIYKAVGRGGLNLAPKAFKSQFPSQVRFTVLEECLPIAEETFRQAIKKNYYTKSKFDCQLSSEQVKDLCKLFTTASKGSRSKDTRLAPETRVISRRDRAKRRGRDERRRPDRAPRRSERVEERVYRGQVEDRRYHEQVEDRGYREHPHFHERSLITSPLMPLAPFQPLPPPAPVQSYAYDRTLGRDPYRRDTVIQHDDSYRQSRLVELPDAYRRDTVIGNPDVYRRRALVEPHDYYRREVIPERREYHQPLNLETRLQDDGGISDPYVSYRERLSYHDPVNSVRSQPEYNPPAAGLRSEYRRGGISTEYSSARSMLPEYPSSAASSLYEYPPRQPQYRY
ncbi:hypothetical protein K7X08_034042 [Anisodus acutangulus]|uniref:DCD domain-containing protein n=1 Tax=Anisodus acutangulus TaxID=402998 RepID=A0A9Q1MIG1_9SOLA|nr:hypothetical protein K7X08_034042 [Anisodus acutangulus]